MDSIPKEIVGVIFSFVPKSSWSGVMTTCRKWNSIGTTVFNPSYDNNSAIRWACRFNKIDSVKKLLKDTRVDPSVDNNCAIRWTSRNGHLEVVKELLKD